MNIRARFLTFTFCVLLVTALSLSSCGTISDTIGGRRTVTPTGVAFEPTQRGFATATPGGRLSVWLITPTGQAGFDVNGTPVTPIPGAQPVGPAATATAARATIEAATATAAAPAYAPYYQPDECPNPGSPAPPPAPQNFNEYSAVIGRYLSNGGTSTVLEAMLRNWGAITDKGGMVQADTDITGDGVLEVLVTLYNPQTYNPDAPLNAGELLVYGCDGGGYRLFYATTYNPSVALPRMLRVGDMNTDVKNELVFYTETCGQGGCYKEGKILSWNSIVGMFEELNSGQIIAINGRLGIVDVDGDGILELTAQINPPGTTTAGPPRSVLDTWDWNGLQYVLALREEEEPRYRIHAVYEADDLLRDEEWRPAINAYAEIRDNDELLSWTTAGEYEALRAYSAFRILITYALLKNARAEDWFNTLQSQNPPGTPGNGFAVMGQAFMDNYRATGDARAACAQAITAGAAQPNVLSLLNSYGYANRTYTLNDLCPF